MKQVFLTFYFIFVILNSSSTKHSEAPVKTPIARWCNFYDSFLNVNIDKQEYLYVHKAIPLPIYEHRLEA